MKLGVTGPSYQMRSLPFDAQRTINFYPVADETGQGKENIALYGTPGLSLFATVGIGPIRGAFSSTNGRVFVVSGTELYEVTSGGATTLRGTLTSDVSNVSIDENTTQMAICDGTDIYIYTYATNVLTKPTLAAYPALTVTELDGYFIYNTSQGEFYISNLDDGTTWDALDFATAESSPDGLVRVLGALGQLWLIGERTTEVWYNSGDLEFPFDKVQGARMAVGCAAAFSVIEIDNTIFWLGKTKDGQGIVYRATGYSPQRISTFAIEYLLSKSNDLSNIRAWAYQAEGHTFYALTAGNLETTIVYDAATQQWHERAYLENNGTLTTHKALTCIFAFDQHIVGDKENGNIYIMSPNYYDDAGQEISSQRIFTHISNEGKSFNINEVQIDFELGVGLVTGQGSDPVVWLQTSFDGGRTWGPQLQASIGKIGAYKIYANWRRLGYTNNIMTFKVTITDPVKRAIVGAYAF